MTGFEMSYTLEYLDQLGWADERAKLQDRIEELEKNLSYEVEQKIKLADTLRDEREKRPDRGRMAFALFEADGRRNYDGSPTPWHILDLDEQAHYRKLADAVLSSLEGGRNV